MRRVGVLAGLHEVVQVEVARDEQGGLAVRLVQSKDIVCVVGLIASPIGLYRKMISPIIFLSLHKVMCIRVRGFYEG